MKKSKTADRKLLKKFKEQLLNNDLMLLREDQCQDVNDISWYDQAIDVELINDMYCVTYYDFVYKQPFIRKFKIKNKCPAYDQG